MSSHVAALVCPNGLGHFRRVVAVLEALQGLTPDTRISVFCEAWQVERSLDWEVAQRFWKQGAQAIIGLMEPGVGWLLDPSGYRNGCLLTWEERVRARAEIHDTDLVISDNLAGVLDLRSDAVLMGSFLWSDVLDQAYPKQPDVQAFVQHERSLLAEHRPPMLCVEAIAMPGVLNRTTPILLPWMCEKVSRQQRAASSVPKVALLGGATGVTDALLVRLASRLGERANRIIALPADLIPQVSREVRGRIEPFAFRAEDYASCDLVVCRPGVGTVTECVAHNVPMVLVHEAGNIEMEHIGERLAERGVAIYAGAELDERAVAEAVEAVLDGDIGARLRSRLTQMEGGGVERAAEWLAHRLMETPNLKAERVWLS